MFDKEQFIADCRTALQPDGSNRYVRDVVARAVSDPGAVFRELGEPTQAGLQVIHKADDLTILNVIWAPNFVIMPHNHAMSAVIGVYTGREDNILWRRLPEDANGRIEAAGAKSLGDKDTLALGADVIHSVVNPVKRLTGAIHVYGGDFFGVSRSEWDPETLSEMPYDMQKVLRMLGDLS
jgi:predicted metal-dependent enzyme (double-stranded beta helix superfamily)